MIDPKQLNTLEQQHGLPSGLLQSVMKAESAGNPNAVSPKGALGLFQFMPETAKAYGINPLDPQQAAVGAARMYGDLSKQYKGDVPSMLAAYNWGSGNLAKQGMANAPRETQDYIAKVQAGLGQQYAAANTGNMTDATVSNTMDVELPDGTVVEGVPAGITQQQLMQIVGKTQQATEEPKSMLQRMGSDIQERGQQSREAQAAYDQGKQGLARTRLQQFGLAGAGTIGDVVGEGVVGGWNALPDILTDPFEQTGKMVAEPFKHVGSTIGKGIMMSPLGDVIKENAIAAKELAERNPERARDISAAFNVANLIPIGAGLKTVATGVERAIPVLGKDLVKAGSALEKAGEAKSLAKQVGKENLQKWSKESYKAVADAGDIHPEYFDKFLDTAKMVMPESAHAQAAFGKGAASDFVQSMEKFRGKPISFNAVQELDKGLANDITKAYRAGDNEEAARLIGIKSALSDTIDKLPEVSKEYNKAKGLFAASARQNRVDSIIENAQFTDNPSTAIRTGFRQLSKEIKKNPRGWTKEEIKAINHASKFGLRTGALKIGGSRLISGIVGATGGGAAGGIPGAILGTAIGEGGAVPMRAAATALQTGRANKVTKEIMKRPVVREAIAEAEKTGELVAKPNLQTLAGQGMVATGSTLMKTAKKFGRKTTNK